MAKTTNSFAFEGKARTLEHVAADMRHGRVLPMIRFPASDYLAAKERILADIVGTLGDTSLIVRSSCHSEDQSEASQAGKYLSILNVRPGRTLDEAILSVISSYGDLDAQDAILVQPMASGVRASGVAMTRDPQSGLPYDVIEYTLGDATDAVTAGLAEVKTHVSLKGAEGGSPGLLSGLFPMLRELESLTGLDALDVEFAITDEGPLLFQVRPMTGARAARGEAGEPPLSALLQAECLKVGADIAAHGWPGRAASPSAWFGLMPDWNPAEMIGVKPRPLAYSLYRALITDMNWASARFRYGYRDMRAQPLMVQFGGAPYIRIASSVESFIPATVSETTAAAVVATCCSYIASNPQSHDKVEFSVVPTCLTPTLAISGGQRVPAFAELTAAQREDYIAGLRSVTERMMSVDGPVASDLKLAPQIRHKLSSFRSRLDRSDIHHDFRAALSEAKIVAEVFAGTARAAFVATAFLKSLESEGELDGGLTDRFIGNTNTIARQTANDFRNLSKECFLIKHGHTRPGTYDIRVPTYDEEPDLYFDWISPVHRPRGPASAFSQDRRSIRSIQQALFRCELQISASDFLVFASNAISAREEFKYLYAAFLSEALHCLWQWGEDMRITRDDVSFLPLEAITAVWNDRKGALEAIRRNRQHWQDLQNVRVPPLITCPADLLRHDVQTSQPNYITRKSANAPVQVVTTHDTIARDLANHIVLIESADPGYDWIFTRKIAGFVTAYGGENSHMSIRAREFAIPAAIGVGMEKFNTLSKARQLNLDCSEQRIEIVL